MRKVSAGTGKRFLTSRLGFSNKTQQSEKQEASKLVLSYLGIEHPGWE